MGMKRNVSFLFITFGALLISMICLLSLLVIPAFAEAEDDSMPDWYDPDFSDSD